MREAQQRVSSREFAEWVAYYGLEDDPENVSEGVLRQPVRKTPEELLKKMQMFTKIHNEAIHGHHR